MCWTRCRQPVLCSRGCPAEITLCHPCSCRSELQVVQQQLRELQGTVAALDADLAGPKQGVEELTAQVGHGPWHVP